MFLYWVYTFSLCVGVSLVHTGLTRGISVRKRNDNLFLYMTLKWTVDLFMVHTALPQWPLGSAPASQLHNTQNDKGVGDEWTLLNSVNKCKIFIQNWYPPLIYYNLAPISTRHWCLFWCLVSFFMTASSQAGVCSSVYEWVCVCVNLRSHVRPQGHWRGCHPQGPQCWGAGPVGLWAAGDGSRGVWGFFFLTKTHRCAKFFTWVFIDNFR